MTTATAAPSRTCRLTLRIAGVNYIVKRVKGGAVRGWDLKKDATTTYHVVKDQWGVVRCDCPSAKSGRCRNNECKHIKSLVATGLIAPSYRAGNKRADAHEAVV